MQPSAQNDVQAKTDLKMRTLRTLWVALCLSIVNLYVMTQLALTRNPEAPMNNALSLTLVAVGLLATLVAVLVRQRFLTKSAEEQRLDMVQQGYVIAGAITEVAALLGLVDFFLTSNRYYYVLFIIAACGQLLNFPRRQHVLDACFKSTNF